MNNQPLTESETNRLIAESLGWKNLSIVRIENNMGAIYEVYAGVAPNSTKTSEIPQWTRSLVAAIDLCVGIADENFWRFEITSLVVRWNREGYVYHDCRSYVRGYEGSLAFACARLALAALQEAA